MVKKIMFWYILQNTLEMIIYDVVNNKKKIIATVMGDNQNPADAAEEIMNKINELRYKS